MLHKFYINTITQEVHKNFCKFVLCQNIVELGDIEYPYEAIKYAKQIRYSNADGCAHCCPQSNNG